MTLKWGLRARFALVCLVVVAAAVAVGGGSAGNRTGETFFDAVPGPGTVTFGENIAYRATFTNTGGSNYTHVTFRMRIPYAEFGTAPFPEATFVASTCPTTPEVQGSEWICRFGRLGPGTAGTPQLVVTVVWKVPTLASTSNCDSCLRTNGRFTVKEGVNDPSDPNDAFPPGGIDRASTLLSAGAGAEETLQAGGYEMQACTDPMGAGNLQTNQAVSLANPVATTFCLPSFATSATDLGLATTITEQAGNARRSEVCIAALGQNCGPTYVEADLSPGVVTFVFRVADAALPKGFKITEVFHNGVLLTPTTCEDDLECLVSIVLDRKTKV